jgi:hypothetical protein
MFPFIQSQSPLERLLIKPRRRKFSVLKYSSSVAYCFVVIYFSSALMLFTIHEMCMAADRGMTISNLRLLEKQGGKSGSWKIAQ